MHWLRDYLRTPSAFDGQPWGYALNQVGHCCLGMCIGWLSGGQIVAAILIYALLIEVPQHLRWQGALSDGLEDTAHVTAGALAGAYGWPAIIVSWLIICSGIALRAGR